MVKDKIKKQQQDSFIAFIASLKADFSSEIRDKIIADISDKVAESFIEFAIERIQNEYGGSLQYIHNNLAEKRRNDVLKKQEEGWSAKCIADELGISVRQVYNILK